MRYYSVILININRGVIEIYDIGTPCTKREAQKYAKNQSFAKNCFILCTIETKEIIDKLALMKFNLKNLKKEMTMRTLSLKRLCVYPLTSTSVK